MVGATSQQLFAQLNDAGIRYCLFKSNAHLEAALVGDTDLDILFDGSQINEVHRVLAAGGFKRFPTRPPRSYPGKEDFFAVDPASGRLLHLDTHHRLVVGASFFKNFRLPWEERFLDSARFDAEHGVYVADPVHELLLLVVRAALKLTFRTQLRPGGPLSSSMGDERDWLIKQVQRTELTELARTLLGERAASLVASSANGGGVASLRELRRELARSLRAYRTYGRVLSGFVRRKRQAQFLLGAVNRRYVHAPFGYSRGGAAGGLIVAVVGADGSGKSTLNRELFRWLTSKLDVLPVYFGSGDGKVSLLRLPLWAIRRLQTRGRPSVDRDPQDRMNRTVDWKIAVWALVLAREKRKKLDKATKARARGMIVICDRYPQGQYPGINDGPLLSSWRSSSSRIRRLLADREARPYDEATAVGPDVVLRLRVSPDVALGRKPGESLANLEFRADLVGDLDFPAARSIIELDADEPAEKVLASAKRELWAYL